MNSNNSAYESASKYLANRMRTEYEVREYLKSKGYNINEIDNSIDEFKMLRYIDDYQYSLSYIDYSVAKYRSSIRIKAELLNKGVSEQIIEETLDDYIEENLFDEYELAILYAKKTCNEFQDVGEKLIGKISRGLTARGFSKDTIYKVVGEMYKWKDLKEQKL